MNGHIKVQGVSFLNVCSVSSHSAMRHTGCSVCCLKHVKLIKVPTCAWDQTHQGHGDSQAHSLNQVRSSWRLFTITEFIMSSESEQSAEVLEPKHPNVSVGRCLGTDQCSSCDFTRRRTLNTALLFNFYSFTYVYGNIFQLLKKF